MHYRPLGLVVAVAGLALTLAAGQSGNAVLDAPRSSSPTPQPAPTASLTPEMRGDIFMARKMFREAIDVYQAPSTRNPVLWNKTGIAYHQLGQLDQAKKFYERAVKLKPDYMEAINNLGTVYYARKSYGRAISYYQKAIKLAPDDPKSASMYVNLGTAFFARKRYEQCAQANQMALNLDPEVFERRGSFGVTLEDRNVEERAKYHYFLAKMYAKSGRNDLALQYLRKALEEGFKERDKLNKDPEFAGLRDLPEFKQLMATEQRVL
jgi:tetratricopeptide (TPR) repeat protein